MDHLNDRPDAGGEAEATRTRLARAGVVASRQPDEFLAEVRRLHGPVVAGQVRRARRRFLARERAVKVRLAAGRIRSRWRAASNDRRLVSRANPREHRPTARRRAGSSSRTASADPGLGDEPGEPPGSAGALRWGRKVPAL
jgi:hypothetical protein